MYSGITTDICRDAWRIVETSAVQAYDMGIIFNRAGTRAGTVIVLDPRVRYIPGLSNEDDLPILFVTSFGSVRKTAQIARKKAWLSWRTGRASRDVLENHPHLLIEGDTKYPGSFVGSGGQIVAFSGVQGRHDEMISEMMECVIRSLCSIGIPEVAAGDSIWIGGKE